MTRASSSSNMMSIAFCTSRLIPANKLVRSVVDAGICSMFVAVPDVDAGISLFLSVVAAPDVDAGICSM
jgi:hypothetical protein